MAESEISVMSGMSEVSAVSGGGQDQGSQKNDDRKKIIVFLALCCCLFLGGVAFVLARLTSAADLADKRESTEDPDYIPSAPSPGGNGFSPTPAGVPPQPPEQSPSAAPQAGRGTTAVKKKRKELPLRPLVCLFHRQKKVGQPYPDDGLCDFMFLTIGMDNTTDEFAYGVPQSVSLAKPILSEYCKQAEKSRLTSFGLDIYDHMSEFIVPVLRKPVGKNALRDLWKSNVHHYSILDLSVFKNIYPPYIQENIEISRVLNDLCKEYIDSQEEENCFVFIGLTQLAYISRYETNKTFGAFNEFTSNMQFDALLFRTTLLDEDGLCYLVAPSQWSTGAKVFEAPTFEDVFVMRKDVTWPASARQMLSFAPFCIYHSRFTERKIKLGAHCTAVEFHDATFRCDPSKNLGELRHSEDGMELFFVKKSPVRATTFETDDTMKKKMCKATVEYNFTGGWAMLDLEYGTMNGTGCEYSKYSGNFQLLKALREFMDIKFTSC